MKEKINSKIQYTDLPPELAKSVELIEAKHDGKSRKLIWSQQGESELQGSPFKVIFAYFGIPVKFDVPKMSIKPYVNWFLIAAIILLDVSLWILNYGNQAVMEYGIIPEFMFRKYGITFLTSFFLHGGVFHLVGNMYFMFIFGDNVEDRLGHLKYLLLLFLATLTGEICYIIFNLGSPIPCIGASGGISGILAFYAILFPKTRVGFMFFSHWSMFVDNWFKIPAWVLFVGWIVLQFLGLGTGSNVAYMAHLGGAAAGIVIALIIKRGSSKKLHDHIENV